MRLLLRGAVASIAGLLFLLQSDISLATDVFADDFPCPATSIPNARKDYRLRNSPGVLSWKYQDNFENHLAPAVRRMDSGDYSTPVIKDLHFTLERWPNHYAALQSLIRYEEGGGRLLTNFQVPCYFQRASRYVPDDANIFVLLGIYRQRLKQDDAAEKSWMYALQIDDSSVEAHYNLGLMYFRQGNFAKSVEHAQIAYELGYPLPGLKVKLIKQGHWDSND